MTPAALAELVRSVAGEVLVARGLDPSTLPQVSVRRPPRPELGDYATAVALRAAPDLGIDAREFAGWLAEGLGRLDGVRCARVDGPGFVGIDLDTDARLSPLADLVSGGVLPGTGFAGRSVAVSVDPGGTRADVVRAALVRLVGHAGGSVADSSAGSTDVLRVRVHGRPLPGLDVIAADLGPDAARYALLRPEPGDPADLDPARWTPRTDVNPLWRVMWAHARATAALRRGGDADLGAGVEGELPAVLVDTDRVLDDAARRGRPALLVRHLEAVAAHADALPADPDPAGLALHAAVRAVLSTGLDLLGIDPVEERL